MSVAALEAFLKEQEESKGIKIKRIVPFWGDEAHKLTDDERAAVILDAMKQVDDGRATVSYDPPNDNRPTINVRDFLERL